MALLAAACFLDALRHNQLLPAAQLDALTREAPRFQEARALGQHLLERGWLTPYQVNQLILERGPDLILGQYVLLERLGEGVRGQVFKARHRHMKRTVALKVIRKELLADADAVQRFYLEIQAASQLDHPNVVHAYDAGPIGPSHFLAMEYVKGTDLARLVQRNGAISIPRACAYVAQAALGLQHATERGLVHRDIKPSNLLVTHIAGIDSTPHGELTESGDSSAEEPLPTEATGLYEWGQVKVLDFGLARLRRFADDPSNPLTHEGAMVGTPDFMAPEQANDAHAVDIRADLYSLGCTLYFLLAGQPPFPGGSYIQKVDGHRWQEPKPLGDLRPGIEPALTAVVQKLMAKRPEDRYQRPVEAAAALAHLMGVPISAPPVPHSATQPKQSPRKAVTLPIQPPPSKGRRGLLLAGLAGLAVCLTGLAVWAIGLRPNPVPSPDSTPPAGTAEGDLHRLVARVKAMPADPEDTWQGFIDLPQRYPNTPEARQAAEWLRRIPSPLDRLQGKKIPSAERYPKWQPKELAAVLGEHQWRHWQMPVRAIAVRPDGQVLASCGDQPEIYVWETATGRLLTVLTGHKGVIRTVAFSPNGKFLASGGQDKTVRVWNAHNYSLHGILTGHGKDTLSIAFSPDSRSLVSGCGGRAVRLWDLTTCKQTASFKENRDGIVAVAFGPDNRTVATSSAEGKIHLWDAIEPGVPLATLAGHPKNTLALAFAPEGNLLASGGEDGWLRLWDTQTFQQKKAMRCGKSVLGLAYSRDGRSLAAISGRVEARLWNTTSGKELVKPFTIPFSAGSLAFAPDGKSLWFGTDRSIVYRHELDKKEQAEKPLDQASPVSAMAFAPDGRTIVGSDYKVLKLWDALAGNPRATVPLKKWSIPTVACSADGRTIALALLNDAEIRLLDGSGQLRSTLPGHKGGVFAVAFAPDGRTLASIGKDQTLRLWDVAGSKERLGRRGVVPPSSGSLAFSPKGELLAFTGLGNTIKVLDLVTEREQASCKGHGDAVKAIAFAPDGRTLASGSNDRSIRQWDALTGRERGWVGEHAASVTALVFTPDGSTLISAGMDGRINFWKPGTKGKQREWKLLGPIHALSLASDGRHLATGNGNGTVYITRLCRHPQIPRTTPRGIQAQLMAIASLVVTSRNWARRNLPWSNSWQSRFERLAAVGLLAGTVAAGWFGSLLPPAGQGAVWIGLVLAFAILLRRGWVKLFGPVFFYDLVRTGRRRPFILVRILYLLIVAGLFYSSATMTLTRGRGDLEDVSELFAAHLHPRQITQMAEAFFFMFLGVQVATAFLLTPVMVAGAIAEQRQRRTLEFLLATDLRNHEIVLGTLASRLAGLLLILLGALPILSLIQFLGGVDPHLLLAGFAATALSVVSLGSLGILNSVATNRPLAAIARTYLEAFAFLALSAGFKFLLMLASLPGFPVPGLASYPSTLDWISPITLQDVCDWLNAGNIGTATFEVGMALDRGTPLDTVLPGLLEGYACFHGLFIALCLFGAVLRLRPIALKLAEGTTKPPAMANRKSWRLVGRWPMLWKEFFLDGRLRGRRLARWGVGFLVFASLVPALAAFGLAAFIYPFVNWDDLADFSNTWLRVVGTCVACLMLISVAFRAAVSVSGERDRQTLDMLLTTPLSSRAILAGKWFGAVAAPRRGWWWLAAIWGMAYLGGGLEPWLVPRLMSAWLVYAAFFASLGLWFSVRCQSATRAILGVILGALAVTCGHWLMTLIYLPFERLLYSAENREWLYAVAQWLEAIHVYTLTPPAVFDLISSQDFESRWRRNMESRDRENIAAGMGMLLYAAGAILLWLWASRYFRRTFNRAPVRPPNPKSAPDPIGEPSEKRSQQTLPEASLARGNGDQP